jgi:hypothetical protein
LHDEIAQKQEDSTSSLFKIEEKKNKFCKILEASDASHARKRRMQQRQEKVGSLQRPKALSES